MKRFSGILFLVLYIFTATECEQLLKFPVLIQHYTEHKKENKSISFFDFIYMHYAGDDFNDNDEDRDMQLPFKSSDNCISHIAQYIPASIQTDVLALSSGDKGFQVLYHDLNLPSSYLSSIWQPPKSC